MRRYASVNRKLVADKKSIDPRGSRVEEPSYWCLTDNWMVGMADAQSTLEAPRKRGSWVAERVLDLTWKSSFSKQWKKASSWFSWKMLDRVLNLWVREQENALRGIQGIERGKGGYQKVSVFLCRESLLMQAPQSTPRTCQPKGFLALGVDTRTARHGGFCRQ